jgi:hypothetical protein
MQAPIALNILSMSTPFTTNAENGFAIQRFFFRLTTGGAYGGFA